MKNRFLKFNWLKKVKISRQVEEISSQAEANIEKHFFKRFARLSSVRRFVIAWIGLVLILIALVILQNFNLSNYFQTLKFVPGGIYTEGIQGTFTNANPVFATSDADSSVSKLIFASLFQYDNQGRLVGDLAKDYSINERGNTYTVHLKPHLKWQDGQPLTAEDVAFTFNTIKNPDTESPLFSNWQGVDVSAVNSSTIEFKLPGILASFPNNLTTGIIPQHLLKNIPPSDLRSASFNTIKPVGAGPFAWSDINVVNAENPGQEEVSISLKPNTSYALGQPKLDKFFINIYADQNKMFSDFKNNTLTGMVSVNTPPKNDLNSGAITHSLIQRAESMVFFKTTTGVLSDQYVRQALVEGTDQTAILRSLGYNTLPVKEPLLLGQLAYNPKYAQISFNLNDAKNKLASDGWSDIRNGTRYKNNQPLSFTLIAANTTENNLVVSKLKDQWRKLGVKLNVQLQDAADFQQALSYHAYDAILTSINIGSDPDVFVYWDSSQADIRSTNRLNLSEYKNPTVDTAVESGRTRLNPTERIIKYQPFLAQWQQDAPALGLYQPRLLYLTNGPVGGIDDQTINTSIDRFNNVQDWAVREAEVTN